MSSMASLSWRLCHIPVVQASLPVAGSRASPRPYSHFGYVSSGSDTFSPSLYVTYHPTWYHHLQLLHSKFWVLTPFLRPGFLTTMGLTCLFLDLGVSYLVLFWFLHASLFYLSIVSQLFMIYFLFLHPSWNSWRVVLTKLKCMPSFKFVTNFFSFFVDHLNP